MSKSSGLRRKKISIDHDGVTEDCTPSLQNQIIAGIICNLGGFSSGASVGWTSPSLEHLKKTGFITETEAALAGGLFAIGACFSVLIFGYIANNKGRKQASYLIGIPLATGFALKAWCGSAKWLLFARLLCGLGAGSATALPPLYIGEIAEPRARGLLSFLFILENSMGLLTAYILGAVLPDINLLAIVLLPFPLIFLLAFWFMPETPLFRLRQGQEEKAARALAWLRKLPLNSKEVKAELKQMAARLGLKLPLPPLPIKRPKRMSRRKPQPIYVRTASIQESIKQRDREFKRLKAVERARSYKLKNGPSTIESLKNLLGSKAGRQGLIICTSLIMTQTFTGLYGVTMYAAFIFDKAGSPLSPDMCAILYAIILICGSLFGSMVIEKAGRRMLQILSCVLIFLCHILTAVSLQTILSGNEGILNWIPLIALPLCVFVYNAGAGNMPFVALSEMFAAEVRDIANTISMLMIWGSCFILLQFFPICVGVMGLHNVFYVFAVVSLLSAIYAYFYLIETKGKSLEDILHELSEGKNAKTNDIYYTSINMESTRV